MEGLVSHFLSLQTVYLVVAVIGTTWFVRLLVETAWPQLRVRDSKASERKSGSATSYPSVASRWWNRVAIRVLPIACGALTAVWKIPLIHGDDPALDDVLSRLIYGTVIAFIAHPVYKALNAAFKKRTGNNLPGVDSESRPPPPKKD